MQSFNIVNLFVVKLFTDTWQCGNEDSDDSLSVREFTFSSDHFATKYDEIQEAVSKLAGLDDLLAGENENIKKLSIYISS